MPAAPPEVLATGRCALAEVAAVHRRLAAGHALPWALAEEREGRRAPGLGPDWPLQRPAPRAMVHPAVAAAMWEWDLGRIQGEDLFLWLRPERLLWSRGEPGRGFAGQEPRRGPLAETVQRALRASKAVHCPAALAAEGDAPGAATLEKALGRADCVPRPLRRPPAERGADRAAAGAALAALEVARPGAYPVQRTRQREPWLWTASFLAAAAVGGAAWLARQEDGRPPAVPLPAAPGWTRPAPAYPAPAPQALDDLLARRRAVLRALETLPATAPPGSLKEIEILASESSRRAGVRMRLLPGGAAVGETVSWRQPLLPGFDLEARVQPDGSLRVDGGVRAEEP